MLRRAGIDVASVRRRWPQLKRRRGRPPAAAGPNTNGPRWPAVLRRCVADAMSRLVDQQSPFTVATEHLLLGLVSGDHEVAAWLREHGLNPEALTREIETLYGVSHEPVPMPEEDEKPAAIERPEVNPFDGQLGCRSDAPERPGGLTTCPAKVGRMDNPSYVGALRVLDAAANRAREGLRVVEDHARFVDNDRFLMRELKQLRHDLAAALARLPTGQLLACRDTVADVGTTIHTEEEAARVDEKAVVAANFKRLQESLRSLAEFGKLIDPAFAAEIEQMRYRSYSLERAAHLTRRSLGRLGEARLYVLVDGCETLLAFETLVSQLIEAGVHMLQLRDKRLDDRTLLARARRLRELTSGTSALWIMNDRPDLAVLAEADGVHVGQEELSVNDARRIVGPDMLIGVSTHSIEQARQAMLDGADYLGLGPTFPSGTKEFEGFPGLDFLRQTAAEIVRPTFAIGGITLGNLGEVLATGIRGVAVGQAVTAAEDPAHAVRAMLTMLRTGSGGLGAGDVKSQSPASSP
jgi:thiamine-phosphate pyrophosphorylase